MSKSLQLPTGWNEKRASSLFQIQGGFAFKSTDSMSYGVRWLKIANVGLGNVKWDEKSYLPEEFLQLHKNFCLNNGDIVVAMTRPLLSGVLKIAQLSVDDSPCLLNQRVGRLQPKEGVSKDFLFHVMKTRRLAYKLESDLLGTDPPNLSIKTFKNIKIPLPPLPEQKAIAELLSTWDEALDKTERLIQAKEANLKGQIQRIMGKEAIDANGWSMVHLGELFSEVTRKVGEKELTPYSISAGIGFVSQREKWGKDISGSQHKNYTHLKAGEFSYNKGNSKRYQQGCVYLLKDGEICVPNVFISFKPKAKNFVPEFFEHYFIADYHARELKRYITSGARSDGLLNLNKKDFFKIMVPCPSPDEQKAIAEALTASQQEIDLLKQLAEKYKTQKRGLMQKMLTSEWRVKPKIVNQYMEA